jgi:hypothetical protein
MVMTGTGMIKNVKAILNSLMAPSRIEAVTCGAMALILSMLVLWEKTPMGRVLLTAYVLLAVN